MLFGAWFADRWIANPGEWTRTQIRRAITYARVLLCFCSQCVFGVLLCCCFTAVLLHYLRHAPTRLPCHRCVLLSLSGVLAVVVWLFPGHPTQSILLIAASSGFSFMASVGGYEASKLEVAAPSAVSLLQGISQTVGNCAALVAVRVRHIWIPPSRVCGFLQ